MHVETHNIKKNLSVQESLQEKMHTYAEFLTSIVKSRAYKHPESALSIVSDAKHHTRLFRKIERCKRPAHVILVGIGGSSLCTEAVYSALCDKRNPALTIVDTLSESRLDAVEALITRTTRKEEIVVVIVTKSGSTTETIFNANAILAMLEKQFGTTYTTQVIAIGDEGTAFFRACKKRNILTFAIPHAISGRFSVFSAVGMVPLTLLGIDTRDLLSGAKDALQKKHLIESGVRAITLFTHAYSGGRTTNFFAFNTEHSALGNWYRQLLAESIGKPQTKNNDSFTRQLLPTVSSSIDLHSLGQLYLGGYKGVFTQFVSVREQRPTPYAKGGWLAETVLPDIARIPLRSLRGSLVKGVLQAYNEKKLPYAHTILQKNSAYEIGFFMASSMSDIMFLCDLCDINAFDQPHVESYKRYMREHLKK